MKDKKTLIIAVLTLVAGLLIAFFLRGSFSQSHSDGRRYFYISRGLFSSSNGLENFQNSDIVKEFNKIFKLKYRYNTFDEKKFWEDKCQLDADPFEFGLMASLYYTCYKQKFDMEKIIPIAKQNGCTPGVFVVSLENKKIEASQLNGKNIGTIRGSNNLIRLFLNEPVAISPGSIFDTESTNYLIQQLTDKKLDYILSVGVSLKDDHYLLRLLGKSLKSEELAYNDKKLHINYVQNIDMPCILIAGNSENPLFSNESARNSFISKINNNLSLLKIDKYASNDEPFVPINREEVEKIQGVMNKAFNYTFNYKADGNQRGGGEDRANPNFQPDSGPRPPEGSAPPEQFRQGDDQGLGGQPMGQGAPQNPGPPPQQQGTN